MPARKYNTIYDVPIQKLSTPDANGCWNWNGAIANGYPSMRIGGNHFKPHRISYQQRFGDLTDIDLVRHLCNNKRCVNPDRLTKGDKSENALDMQGATPSIGGIHRHNNGWRAKISILGRVERKYFQDQEDATIWLHKKRMEAQHG